MGAGAARTQEAASRAELARNAEQAIDALDQTQLIAVMQTTLQRLAGRDSAARSEQTLGAMEA